MSIDGGGEVDRALVAVEVPVEDFELGGREWR